MRLETLSEVGSSGLLPAWGGGGRKVLTPPLHPSTTSHPPQSTALLTISKKNCYAGAAWLSWLRVGLCKAASSSNLG